MRSASFVLPVSSFLLVTGTWCRARFGSGTCCAFLLLFSERDALILTYGNFIWCLFLSVFFCVCPLLSFLIYYFMLSYSSYRTLKDCESHVAALASGDMTPVPPLSSLQPLSKGRALLGP